MMHLNTLHMPLGSSFTLSQKHNLSPLNVPALEYLEELKNKLCTHYKHVNTYDFTAQGVQTLLELFLKEGKKIAISVKESLQLTLAKDENIVFIQANADASFDEDSLASAIECCDVFFISHLDADIFTKNDLSALKKRLGEKLLISNITHSKAFLKYIDIAYIDVRVLTGFTNSALFLHNDFFQEQRLSEIDMIALDAVCTHKYSEEDFSAQKELFFTTLKHHLGENVFTFFDYKDTFKQSLHIGLKGIKARDLMRTLAMQGLYVTNGQGCSLGYSQPSFVLRALGFDEMTARGSLSLSFHKHYSTEEIKNICLMLTKAYKRVKQFA